MTLKIRTRLLLCVIMFSALIADAWAMMVYCGWAKNWIWVKDCSVGVAKICSRPSTRQCRNMVAWRMLFPLGAGHSAQGGK